MTNTLKDSAVDVMQEYFPAGGRDYDHICELFDAIADGRIPGVQIIQLNPSRSEMVEYLKTAIGEGYQPEHEAAVIDLAIVEGLNDHDLNREFGKCWQWYNMGGGIHETFDKKVSFEQAAEPLIKWLAENVHPHHTVIVTSTDAELLQSEKSHLTDKFLVD